MDYSMLREAYGDDDLRQTKIYEWFKRFKNGRTSTVWLTFNFKIRTSDCPGEKHYPWKLSADCLRNCRRGWNIHRFMPINFNGRFRNASGLSKICAKTLE
jgi:hypothetical protein